MAVVKEDTMEEILQEIEEPKSRVFILKDDNNRVTRIEGEYTLPQDLTNWILIDEGYGDKYNLAQTHYLEKGLMTEDGIYQYKYENEEVIERTEEEIEADREAVPVIPTQMEQLESQVMYTALMTDTLLEE
jgi:hypothetical protein